MKLKLISIFPYATFFPDTIDKEFDLYDVFDSLIDGDDFYFIYSEDFTNYTPLVNGEYIFCGYEGSNKIGDWLVDVTIFGNYQNLRAIVAKSLYKVVILKEIKTEDSHNLDKTNFIYKRINTKKIV